LEASRRAITATSPLSGPERKRSINHKNDSLQLSHVQRRV
jgi:hypothetical protein